MLLAIFGVLFVILATIGGYWHGMIQRYTSAPEKPVPQRVAPAVPMPAPLRPLPPPGVELPSDDRRRTDSLPPPSEAK